MEVPEISVDYSFQLARLFPHGATALT